MDQNRLLKALADLPLGAVRYYDRVGSTNDEAAAWAWQGAPDNALVVAEEQTAGRGRSGRKWTTIPGASLAFSVILYPTQKNAHILSRLTALGALAVKDALQNLYGLPAQIKWPNDVLVHRQKISGILGEAYWLDDRLDVLILGIGINIAAASVDGFLQLERDLSLPATSIEIELGYPVDRIELLHEVMAGLLRWWRRLPSLEFLRAWESSLAFREEPVEVITRLDVEKGYRSTKRAGYPQSTQEGWIIGLAPDGSLKLRTRSGELILLQAGEIRIRPVEVTALR